MLMEVAKNHATEAAAAVAKSVPSAAVIGATIFGFTVQEAASILACLFILLQMSHLGWKWNREAKGK